MPPHLFHVYFCTLASYLQVFSGQKEKRLSGNRPVCKLSYVKSQNILLFILVKFTTCFCEKCTKRGISIYADSKCLFFCSLVFFFSFFLQLRKFSIMTFSASASVMPSVLSFNSCSSLIRPIAASWMIAASTCFAWISGIDPTWA